jgi:3-hydroxyanthranilate 3,4-dioxygenase
MHRYDLKEDTDMYTLNGINFREWIDEHRHLLKPPVGNSRCSRTPSSSSWSSAAPTRARTTTTTRARSSFYQLEGDITLKVMDDGVARDIPIREGEIFLLPARVPHSPQRPAGTVGLVIERMRREGELDGCFWYCESCGEKLHEEYFPMANIVTQLPEIMNAFYASEEKRQCGSCGAVMLPPLPAS